MNLRSVPFFRTASAIFGLASVLCHVSTASAQQPPPIWEDDGVGPAVAYPFALGSPADAGGNYPLVQQCASTSAACWERFPGAGSGTALAVSQSNELWVVSRNSTAWVWRGQPAVAKWVAMPKNKCEGGTLAIQQVPGRNSIAVGKNTVYVIEQFTYSEGIRYMNAQTGTCWQRMPDASQTDFPNSIAIINDQSGSQTLDHPWIATQNRTLFRWTGSSWLKITTGSSQGVGGRNRVIGSDGTSIWNYNVTADTFAKNTTWTFGAIRQLDSSAIANSFGPAFGVSRTDSHIWVYR